jgi:ferredoxin
MQLSCGEQRVLDIHGFERLLLLLRDDGFELLGPSLRDGAIVLGTIDGIEDLPRGVGDEQSPGRYRLRPREDDQLFGWAVPAQPWKSHFLPARLDLVRIRRKGTSLEAHDAISSATPVAVIGARPCEVAAMSVQDRVLRDGPHSDADYAARRQAAFVLAVNCGTPSGTCFCASMNTGPRAKTGFDLAATELTEPRHRFVMEVGTEAGARLLERVKPPAATNADVAAAEAVVAGAAMKMGRALDTKDLPERLLANLEHPRWDDVADRCLGCGNCTFACPTCFCTTVEDASDLGGEVATRTRTWDSCFAPDFAYIHGGSVRPTLRSRYRQWHTHKLATWVEQFGTSGCVGCGRCITWCPVGIDLTVEAAAVGEDRG